VKLYEPTVDAGFTVSESGEERGIRQCNRYVCLTGPGSSPCNSTRNILPYVHFEANMNEKFRVITCSVIFLNTFCRFN